MINQAKKYMIEMYGIPKLDETDEWHKRFGMLVDFIFVNFTPECSQI